MIDHMSIAVRDLAASARFYETVLATLGYDKLADRPATIGFGKKYPELWLNERRNMTPVDADTGAVVDQGKGMDSEFVRNQLYQPFASTKYNGFGIGAFEARSLIQAMGGSIEVDSRPGQGTTFILSLPAAAPAANFRNIA